MERLPFDIVVNHIIPYTYNIQSKLLLEDIKNYYEIKNKLMDNNYDINSIKHEILAIFYDNNYTLIIILDRYFSKKLLFNKSNFPGIYKYSNNKKFSILFGLLRPNERTKFLEHIKEDDSIWFIK